MPCRSRVHEIWSRRERIPASRHSSRSFGRTFPPKSAEPEGWVMRMGTRIAFRRLVGLIAFLVLWEVFTRSGILNPFFVPPPSKVAATLVTLFVDGDIW